MSADRAEAAFWAAFLRNRNVDADTAGDGAMPVAGGYAICAVDACQQVALAVGSTRPLDENDLALLAAFYGARGLPVRIEIREQALERDRSLLEQDGYTTSDTKLLFYERAVGSPPAVESRVSVRRAPDRAAWVRLVTAAFAEGAPTTAQSRRSAELCAGAAAALFVADVDGVPAGGAALGVAGEYALLYCGGVLPAFRRLRVHRALLDARLADAHARGIARATIKVPAGSVAEQSVTAAGFERALAVGRAHRSLSTEQSP